MLSYQHEDVVTVTLGYVYLHRMVIQSNCYGLVCHFGWNEQPIYIISIYMSNVCCNCLKLSFESVLQWLSATWQSLVFNTSACLQVETTL